MIYKLWFAAITVILILSCDKESQSNKHLVDDSCVTLKLNQDFSPKNNYQMVYLGNINSFRTDSNCFRLNDWINQEIYLFERNGDFLDTLSRLDEIPLIDIYESQSNEYLRLVKYQFAFGQGKITLVDCVNYGKTVEVSRFNLVFDRACNFSLVSIDGNKDFSSDCFQLIERKNKSISIDKWSKVWDSMMKTDFLNIAYFDTGAMSVCDGYDIQIIYDQKSSIINGEREFYRSCPGEFSPISIVAQAILNL